MSIQIHPESLINQLPEAARETAQAAADGVEDVAKAAEDATKDLYQSTKCKAAETLATSKEYVRRHPVPTVLGALAFGVALGYLLVRSQRKHLLSDHFAGEPLAGVREAILGALAPVSQRVHKGYDSAREGAGKVMDGLHHMGSGRADASISDQIGRIGNNLKFW